MFDDDLTVLAYIIRIFCLLMIIGAFVLLFTGTLGHWANQIDNDLFNTSKQHMGAIEQAVSNDCLQLATTKDVTEKHALERDIYEKTSTVNRDDLNFSHDTRDCMNSAVSDITHGN